VSTYDPGRLAFVLEDLHDELAQWSTAASEILRNAEHAQRHAAEVVEQVAHRAALTDDQARRDRESVQRAAEEIETAFGKGKEATNIANKTLKTAERLSQIARTTLNTWEAALKEALAWLQRAETRLAQAIQQLQQAEYALAVAHHNVQVAKSNLEACMNSDRRCNREKREYEQAIYVLEQAQQFFVVAQAEVVAAQAEVAQAQARVTCCQAAVGVAKQAVGVAQDAQQCAIQCVKEAELSLEYAQSAERMVSNAQKTSAAEMDVAEQMMMESRKATSHIDQAQTQLNTADRAEASAQRNCSDAQREINYRVQRLRDLNRPGLGSL
jgi:chromosome segregation ATPase